MSGYSINTLFGDTPEVTVVEVPVTRDPGFVMGNPSAKIWSTVVQREKDGKVLQKDTTGGMGLIEAINHANNMRSIYRLDGFIESEDGERFTDPKQNGEYVYIFVL